jgi:hypothetical protein
MCTEVGVQCRPLDCWWRFPTMLLEDQYCVCPETAFVEAPLALQTLLNISNINPQSRTILSAHHSPTVENCRLNEDTSWLVSAWLWRHEVS